jgi:hypothetical protein
LKIQRKANDGNSVSRYVALNIPEVIPTGTREWRQLHATYSRDTRAYIPI